MKMQKKLVEGIIGGEHLQQEPKGIIQGTVRGYQTLVECPGKYFRIVICGKSLVDESGISTLLANMNGENKLIQSAKYSNYKVEIIGLGNATASKLGIQINEMIRKITSFMSDNRFVNCCSHCGEEIPTRMSQVNGNNIFLCDACHTELVAEVAQLNQQKARKKGNMVSGIVGSFLGSLIGVALWIVIYQMGYIAGIAGMVTVVCGLKGYEKFGGKVNVVGIIISLALSVGMIYVANMSAMALSLYLEVKDTYSITFFEAFKAVPQFVRTSKEVAEAYYHDLGVGYLLTAVAAVPTIIGMMVDSVKGTSVKRL